MIDIMIARLKHVEWAYQLELALKKKDIIFDIGSYDQCELGQWLYSEAIKLYANIPEIDLLESSHKMFHLAAERVVKWHNAPRISTRLDAQAQVDFEEAQRMSKDIIYSITMLEFRLLKKYKDSNAPDDLKNMILHPLKTLNSILKK
ncbi:MAG: CZB domain-containing protein [Nitrospirae bacterium]|nr:CZB domain-containing protein [Nitrospirota bacterium]